LRREELEECGVCVGVMILRRARKKSDLGGEACVQRLHSGGEEGEEEERLEMISVASLLISALSTGPHKLWGDG
jgi:hypothetical protein